MHLQDTRDLSLVWSPSWVIPARRAILKF